MSLMSRAKGTTGRMFPALILAGTLGLLLWPFPATAMDGDALSSDVPAVAIDAPPMPEADRPEPQTMPPGMIETTPAELGGTGESGAVEGMGAEIVPGDAAVVGELEHAEHASGGGAGFPQLDPSSYASQVFWLAVAFVLLYGLMSRVALPRIEDVLERRRAQREGDLGEAEKFRAEAAKVKSSYESQLARAQADAQTLMAEAEADIKEISAARNAAFAENARRRIALSEDTIGKARDAALAQVADIAADIAAEASGKIAGVGIGKADAKKVVQSLDREVA